MRRPLLPLLPLAIVAAVFVLAAGGIHLREWAETHRYVPADVPGAFVPARASGTPTSLIASSSMGSTGDMGHGGAGQVTLPEADADSASAPAWLWLPAGLLGAGATGLALSARPERLARRGRPREGRRDLVLALALTATGVVHWLETPDHWAEGWHLGAFFAASGAVLLGQALAGATGPSRRLYASVLATMVVLVVLYVLAREMSLPFIDHEDPYLLPELSLKALEIGVAGLSLLRLNQLRRGQPVLFPLRNRSSSGQMRP